MPEITDKPMTTEEVAFSPSSPKERISHYFRAGLSERGYLVDCLVREFPPLSAEEARKMVDDHIDSVLSDIPAVLASVLEETKRLTKLAEKATNPGLQFKVRLQATICALRLNAIKSIQSIMAKQGSGISLWKNTDNLDMSSTGSSEDDESEMDSFRPWKGEQG